MIASWIYSVGLLILGFVLILLEIFVIPGFNIFGLMGLLTLVAGVGHAYLNLGVWPAAGVATLGLLGTGILLYVMVRARAWDRMVLHSATSREQGYDSVEPGREELLGQQGQALSDLRPSGRAQFGESVVDVISEGGFIEHGAAIEVIRVAGSKVVVQPRAEVGLKTEA
jgi:membrane-bound serine protease (ClpP class)